MRERDKRKARQFGLILLALGGELVLFMVLWSALEFPETALDEWSFWLLALVGLGLVGLGLVALPVYWLWKGRKR